jgi:hypothetical protein
VKTKKERLQELAKEFGGEQKLMDACFFLLIKEDFETMRKEDPEGPETVKEFVESELEMLYDDHKEAMEEMADRYERALKIGKKEKL